MLEGDNIVSAARRAIMRHDYSAVLTIFPILKHLKMTKPEFDTTLQVRFFVLVVASSYRPTWFIVSDLHYRLNDQQGMQDRYTVRL